MRSAGACASATACAVRKPLLHSALFFRQRRRSPVYINTTLPHWSRLTSRTIQGSISFLSSAPRSEVTRRSCGVRSIRSTPMASLRFAVFAISCALLAASAASLPAAVFNVGDERGWAVPSGNGTETYNHWAKRNRFQVGDILSTCSCTSNQSLYFSHGMRVFGLIDRVPPRCVLWAW